MGSEMHPFAATGPPRPAPVFVVVVSRPSH
jgi:hypothetical protein